MRWTPSLVPYFLWCCPSSMTDVSDLWPFVSSSDLWLRPGADSWPWARPHRILDWVRGHTLVQSSRNHAQLKGRTCNELMWVLRWKRLLISVLTVCTTCVCCLSGLLQVHWHMVSGLHPGWDVVQQAYLSRETLLGPAQPHTGYGGVFIHFCKMLHLKCFIKHLVNSSIVFMFKIITSVGISSDFFLNLSVADLSLKYNQYDQHKLHITFVVIFTGFTKLL